MNEIAVATAQETTALTLAESQLPDTLLNFVARAVRDPSIDVDKLKALITIQREIVADDARVQYIRAMAAAQGEMVPVIRDATNDQTRSKYARLETIDAAVRPIYFRHGFILEFNSEAIEGPNERIVCEVSHAAGHTKKFQLEAAPDTMGPQGKANKTALHGLASTVSYLRRYLTCMIFNIVLANEDNDGNHGRREDTGELAGRNQVEELSALMRETGTEEVRLLRHYFPEPSSIRSIRDVPVGHYIKLKNALLTKKNILAQRAAREASKQSGATA